MNAPLPARQPSSEPAERAWQELLDEAVDRRFAQMVEVRRRLHAHPEVSGEERETTLYLYRLLGDEGIDVQMGPDGRGIIADVRNSTPAAKRIALRADIDALHIHEKNTAPYASRKGGVMHACGHDGHTAVVFGAFTALADLIRGEVLPWPMSPRAIFQPAEETSEGAKAMVAVGALEGISAIVAVHVDPTRPVGKIGLRRGVLTASCDDLAIHIVGQGGHAARPHESHDPIAAAAHLITAVYQFIPRATDSQDAVVVTFGQISGGDNANVIPEEVLLKGTIRTLSESVRRKTFDHLRRIARGVADTTGTKITVSFDEGTAPVVNDPALIELLRRSGRDVLGEAGLDEIPRPSMGSEDFSNYLDKVPGAMIRLGCTSERAGGSLLHTPTFDLDEEALRLGAKILARTAVYWSQPDASLPPGS